MHGQTLGQPMGRCYSRRLEVAEECVEQHAVKSKSERRYAELIHVLSDPKDVTERLLVKGCPHLDDPPCRGPGYDRNTANGIVRSSHAWIIYQ